MKIVSATRPEIIVHVEVTGSEIELLVDLLDRKLSDSYCELFKLTEKEREVLRGIATELRKARSAVRSA